MIVEFLIFALTTLVAYIYYNHQKKINEFTSNGVKVVPGVPVFGNFLKSTFLRKHVIEEIHDCYKAFPDERYVGILENTTPILLIRDPEIMKLVTVKDFDHFMDHKPVFEEGFDDLFSNSILMLKGDKWRDMRTTLSPAFTGSKIRQMVPFMNTIAQNIVKYLQSQFSNAKDNVSDDIDINDLIRRYTNDVIASTAFGLEVNSVTDKSNQFYVTGQKLTNFSAWQRLRAFIIILLPKIAKKFNMKFFPQDTADFFRNIVKNTMDYREKNGVERSDMIQLLMEAAKGTLKAHPKDDDNVGFATTEEASWNSDNSVKQWTDDELTGQAFIFFFAGFESSATVLVMSVHEMVLNTDVQEKLYEEIKQFNDTNKSVTYESVQDLKYLDMVINETFRKWSPAIILDRECIKPYELPPPRPGAKPYKVKRGQVVYNVVNSIHMDEKYYPDPERFDPERFSEENKKNIKPFTFMPFGMGPRNCIGSRFALLELKVLLYHLILNFEILKCDKTSDPLRLKPSDFKVEALGGTWVKLRKRN